MLELRSYTKAELSALFGTKSKQGLTRKLDRYGIAYKEEGRGESLTFEITAIADPFKIFCITELGFPAQTNFKKLRNFYYYYFNDEVFMAMPDEVKETMLASEDKEISRQTIANYTNKLVANDLIDRNTKNCIYYFAYQKKQRLVEHAEYSQAWKEYWDAKRAGVDYYTAIDDMIANYGGVARKQPIPEINGIYNEKIQYMLNLIQESIENERKQ